MPIVHYAAGFITCAILYTFFPALAIKPSKALKKAWAWIQERKNR